MFQTKKKKIINYLNEKNTANAKFSPFDLLLSDYISGELKIRMEEMDIVKPDIYYILIGFRIINVLGFRGSISNIMWIYRLSQQRFRLDVIRMNRMSTLYSL